MNHPDTLTDEQLGEEFLRRLTHRQQERDARRPGYDLEEAVRECADTLAALADSANMRTAHDIRMRAEEASAFLGYLSELSKACDDMFRRVLRLAGDNVGTYSPDEQAALASAKIVTDALHDNWISGFQTWAEGAARRPESYAAEYGAELRAERSQR